MASITLATYSKNSFTYELAEQLASPEGLFPGAQLMVMENPSSVIDLVASDQANYGLVPWWNLYANTRGVPVPYRLLAEKGVFVHRVVRKRIKLCMAATPGTAFGDVKTVYTMSVLRPQCGQFIDGLLGVDIVDDAGIKSTPEAMDRALSHGSGAAAIGPLRAATEKGLDVLQDGVENPENTTSFFVISRLQPTPGGLRLLFAEVSSEVSEDEALGKVLAPMFRRSEYLAYDFRLEDRVCSGEKNHLFIVSASPSPEPPFPLVHEHLVSVKDIGAALDADGPSY